MVTKTKEKSLPLCFCLVQVCVQYVWVGVCVWGKRPVPLFHISRWINLLFNLVIYWLTWIWSCVFFNGFLLQSWLKGGRRAWKPRVDVMLHARLDRRGEQWMVLFQVVHICRCALWSGWRPAGNAEWKDLGRIPPHWSFLETANCLARRPALTAARLLLIPEVWLVNQRKSTPTVAFSASHLCRIALKLEHSPVSHWFAAQAQYTIQTFNLGGLFLLNY